jgi:Cellulose biosynthesis protein BcsS
MLFFAPSQSNAAEERRDKPRELDTVLFGSLDAGRSVFVSAGFKRTLGGSLDRDGFVLMAGAGAAGEPERGPLLNHATFRPTAHAHALLGYQWMLGRAAVTLLTGPEFDAEMEAPNAWQSARTRFGLRGHAEVWAHPTPETLATATLIAGSAREHIWGRISGGYAFWPGVFLGPEASVYAREDYREWRLGGHLTGLKWGRFNFRLSGGYLQANDDRNGAYFGLSGYVRM